MAEVPASEVDQTVYQDLRLYSIPPGFRGRPAWFVQLWWTLQGTLFRWSPQVLYGWRRFLLRCFGASVGEGAKIRPSATVTYPWKLKLGDRAQIGDHVTLYTLGPITIGNDAIVSQHSYLSAGSHDYKKPSFDIYALPITVEEQAWVASHVFIGPGVRVGRGAVVGACSVCFRDVPAGMLCVGNPARPIRPRHTEPAT